MNAALKGSCLVGMGVFVVFFGRPARAAEEPLLVVVEAPPALDADAAEIRRAIGTELRSQTSAPMKMTGEPAGRALIVALDREKIAMSLRTGDGASVGRVIPAPAEHAARLRAIAWLAGNLARDQVTPILADTATIPLATIPSIAPAPTTEPPPVSRPPTEPLPLSEAPTTIAAQMTTPKPSAASHWSIGVAAGPTVALYDELLGPNDSLNEIGTTWRIEVQRQSGPSGLFIGGALEGTTGGYSPQPVGAMAFLGTARRWERWRFEGSVDAGVELIEHIDTSANVPTMGFTSYIFSPTLRPSLYGGGAIAIAHPIAESLDAVLRIGAHLSTVEFDDWFLTTTLGLRYNL